ncbi:MAG: hypothetical protein ABSC94_01400 [Polyangiaceae bacterium]|jgi:hypothetical protein
MRPVVEHVLGGGPGDWIVAAIETQAEPSETSLDATALGAAERCCASSATGAKQPSAHTDKALGANITMKTVATGALERFISASRWARWSAPVRD